MKKYNFFIDGENINVVLTRGTYLTGGLAIILCIENEYGDLKSKYQVSYNIPEKMRSSNKTFLDMYKYPQIREFFENNKIGYYTGRYCTGINGKVYPEYEVDLDFFVQTPGFNEGEYN